MPYVSKTRIEAWATAAGVPAGEAPALIPAVRAFEAYVVAQGGVVASSPAGQQAVATALGITIDTFYKVEALALQRGEVIKV